LSTPWTDTVPLDLPAPDGATMTIPWPRSSLTTWARQIDGTLAKVEAWQPSDWSEYMAWLKEMAGSGVKAARQIAEMVREREGKRATKVPA
jgi:hypothetical protein